MGFSEFSLGGHAPILNAGKARWKPQKGKYRVSFVALPGLLEGNPDLDADAPLFTAVQRLYMKGVGYFVDYGSEYTKIAGSPSKTALATSIIFWPVDANGVLDKARLSKGEYEVKTWVFSRDKYIQLVAIHSEFPLTKHDLNVVVTDPQYHKMTFSPCRDSLLDTLKTKKVELFDEIVGTAKTIQGNIRNDIAQDLTLDQIREKLSGEVGSPVVGGGITSNVDVDDVLDDVLK